jgi:hypothetical protein
MPTVSERRPDLDMAWRALSEGRRSPNSTGRTPEGAPMRTTTRVWFIATILVFLAGGFVAAPFSTGRGVAYAGDGDDKDKDKDKPQKSVDAADVYYGDAKKWEKPAEVDADKVYAKIDEYKQIVDGGLKPGDAKYEILMCKASKRFHAAVKKAAKDGGYDLVAKLGAVKGVATPPDVTSDAIADL